MATQKDILEDVLTQSFDLKRYMKFIREFFNSLEVKSLTEKTDIATKFAQFSYTIASYHDLARYIDSRSNKIAILAVKLKSGRSVERARSVQRNFVSKIITDAACDAAIVAFYTEGDTKWRLSFVRLDQTWNAGKFKTKITPAKRYSYLVGEKEPCHTAKERLFPIFESEDFNPNLDKIEEAFSVEAVTDEFFKEYKETYYTLKDHLDHNKQFVKIAQENQFTSEQFAKKLMGQLAFLYFLQKKGWLGVEGIPRTLNDKEYKNAYWKKHSPRVKDIIETIYKKAGDDEYRLNITLLTSSKFSNEDAQILAKCFTNHKWGAGEKMFIRHLFEHCKKQKGKNFFADFLQPLFYEALRTNRGGNQYYKRFNCKIPFLNGGLFDPIENYDWEKTSFDIPNELFSNCNEKGEYSADGILDMFERYNFTMNEDEPLEREVAVDPEMLGKIFENLLDDTDRKAKGAFYTPREIVHYMCQESLIQYLINETSIPYDDMKKFVLYGEIMKDEDMYNTDSNRKCLPRTVFEKLSEIETALKNIRIADPAVGSGAFPLGILSEIIKIRTNIVVYNANQISSKQKELRAQYYETNNPYNLKLETIKDCIHAVDIEASAVDIAKLRLWLSLVVDEDLEPTYLEVRYSDTTQRDPHPLPNLDYNIMCGNSLVDEFEGIKLFDENIILDKTKRKDTPKENVQTLLFKKTASDLLNHLFELQEKFFDESDANKKLELKARIDRDIDKIIRAKLEQDGDDASLAKYEKSLQSKVKPYFLWYLEFAKVFKEKGGFDVVIGNPPYGANIDDHIKLFERIYPKTSHGFKDIYKYFFDKSLSLLQNNGVLSFITPNTFLRQSRYVDLRRLMLEYSIIQLIDLGEHIFEAVVPTAITLLSPLKNEEVLFTDLTKFADAKIALQSICYTKIEKSLYQTTPNNIFIKDIRSKQNNEFLLDEILEMKDAGFKYQRSKVGLSQKGNNDLAERIFYFGNKENKKDIPVLIGKDINSYFFSVHPEKKLRYNYEDLLKSNEGTYFNKKIMNECPKIIWRQTAPFFIGTILTLPLFFGNTIQAGIIREAYKDKTSCEYLCALLNSKYLRYLYENNVKEGGRVFPQVKLEKLKILPIIVVENQKPFVTLVNQIIESKLDNPHFDTASLEAQIDAMVFHLYGLTEDEMLTVLLSLNVSEAERREIQTHYKKDESKTGRGKT